MARPEASETGGARDGARGRALFCRAARRGADESVGGRWIAGLGLSYGGLSRFRNIFGVLISYCVIGSCRITFAFPEDCFGYPHMFNPSIHHPLS